MGVMVVTREQFERETNYGASMAIARSLLTKGFISAKDYQKINTIFVKKYRPLIGGLQAKIP